MIVAAGLVGCLLLSGQVSGEVETSVRADSRAGLSPGADAQSMAPTAELLVQPGIATDMEVLGVRANASYTPTVQLRSQWPTTATVLGQHTASVSATAGELPRWGQLTGSASLVLGRVDLGTASRLLGQAAGASVGGTLSIADGRVGLSYRSRPLRTVEVTTRAALNVLGLPSGAPTSGGFDPLAYLLLPDLSQLSPYAQLEVENITAWRVTRNTTLSSTLRGHGVGQLQPVSFLGLLAFGSVRQVLRPDIVLSGSLGALSALEQSGLALHGVRSVLTPYADAQLEAGSSIMRGLDASGSFGASLSPSYDLFLAQVTHRATLRLSGELTYHRLSLRGSASTFSLLPETAIGALRPAATARGDAHVVSGNLTVTVQIVKGLLMGAGTYGFARAAAHPEGFYRVPLSVLPEVMGFAYIQGQTGIRL